MQQKASPTSVEIPHKQNTNMEEEFLSFDSSGRGGHALQTALEDILMKVLPVLHPGFVCS